MAGCSGRSAPGAIWFEGPIMHEKINQSLAHSSHVETGNGRRQRGRERQVELGPWGKLGRSAPLKDWEGRLDVL